MFRKISFKSVIQNLVYVLAGVILAALVFAGGGSGSRLFSQQVQAAERPLPATATNILPAAPAGETWVTCTPVVVGTFSNRIYVRCAQSYGGVDFFAAPTSNPAHAARLLSTLSAAQIAGRTLNVLYDPADNSGVDFGCDPSNCGVLRAAEFGQ